MISKRSIFTLIAVFLVFVAGNGIAQTAEDGSAVLLPLEAQSCNYPGAPAKLPEEPDFETLKAGVARFKEFQVELEEFRGCLEEAGNADNLTEGNRIALNNAHNDSVDMETRLGDQLNTAVRAYNARQKADKE